MEPNLINFKRTIISLQIQLMYKDTQKVVQFLVPLRYVSIPVLHDEERI